MFVCMWYHNDREGTYVYVGIIMHISNYVEFILTGTTLGTQYK